MMKLPRLAARISPRKFRIDHMTSVKFVSYSVMTTVKQLVKHNGHILLTDKPSNVVTDDVAGNITRRGPDRLLILGGTAAARGHRGRVTCAQCHDPHASDGIHQTPRLLPLSPAKTCSDGCDPHPGKERAKCGAVLMSQS
jgi:hypothetical protein